MAFLCAESAVKFGSKFVGIKSSTVY